ncbi:hypothetical protein SSX86_005253 [Deinandra increscens subsp. villosa]|uniref:J domain-containing protein n=1 Tax=Deinandra increscens subsp. villosa TaxID=3103831 RepID=A0AAP0H6P8_9ASTR
MAFIDHYLVLGLQSGKESFSISITQINKAYRSKALELHPDKRPNDPDAVALFQSLQASYEILKNENTRKAFDFDLMHRMQQQKVVDEEEKVEPPDCDNNIKRDRSRDHDHHEERKCGWSMMFDAEESIVKMMDDYLDYLNARMGVLQERNCA